MHCGMFVWMDSKWFDLPIVTIFFGDENIEYFVLVFSHSQSVET